MYAQVNTGSLYGIEAETVLAETDLARGLPGFFLVGLADLAVREARERIRAALVNQGYQFPAKRVTVNLAPAGKKKEGTHFDLPIAVSILAALGEIPREPLGEYAFFGELALNGEIKRVAGLLPLLIGMRERGVRKIFLPRANLTEAGLLPDMLFYPVDQLKDAVAHFDGTDPIKPLRGTGKQAADKSGNGVKKAEDFADVQGQEAVKRAVLTAAAGGHGFLLVGPPGVGKTMICRRLPGILPPLSYEEQLEVTRIYSAAGKLTEEQPIIRERPFRAPHYSLSAAALCGGGGRPRPGEVSLAHRGVLFLDELPEFKRPVLELLRTPMEEGKIVICRSSGHVSFPARFMLAAAMNPCRCGYSGDAAHQCTCTEAQKHAYLSKLSGPVLDRIDLHIGMAQADFDLLKTECGASSAGENKNPAVREKNNLNSAQMRRQVEAARAVQAARYANTPISCNFELTPALIEKYCQMTNAGKRLYFNACRHYSMSVRSCHKILRLSRTIADLEGDETLTEAHLAEALQYRCLDKLYQNSDRVR